MKRISTLILVFAALYMLCCNVAVAQIETCNDVAPIGMSDSDNAQLYGKVHTVKESVFTVDYSRNVIDKGEFINSHITTYNSFGNEESVVKLDAEGAEVGKSITQYNEDRFKRVTTEYNELGERIMQTLYSFTADGVCAQMRLTDAMAITMATAEVSHGDNWASIGITYVGPFGDESSESRFEYNSLGRIEKSTIKAEGSIAVKLAKLDSNGYPKIIVTTVNGKTESKRSYKYVLDSNNNWTERIEYADNKPVEIRYRTIEYFK
ncbi:MAG: hypothetical protein MJZ31_03195 [Bacteroidales bacterium]|nr:hypothetical protein [Bacteroidales bacterium]